VRNKRKNTQWALERPMKPVLQVALDLMHLKRAVEIGKEAVDGGADWIEAGTPLIKSEGVESIRALKKALPGHVIVADMKTMDVGGFEVEIAAKAGADVITVMGLSDDATIEESSTTARRYGAKVMVDLMNVPDKVARAKEVESLGCFLRLHSHGHRPADERDRRLRPSWCVRSPHLSPSRSRSPAASPRRRPAALAKSGASIIIVGGGIIKTEDVKTAARKIKEAIEQGSVIPTDFERKYTQEELFEAFSKVSAPNIADAQHKRGVLRGVISRNPHGTKMVGRALTVQTVKGDWAKPVEAIDRASKGDVIVIDVGGAEVAVWGELASWSAKLKGVAGVVIDGAARDIDGIVDMGFPCFSRSGGAGRRRAEGLRRDRARDHRRGTERPHRRLDHR
jgi:3-hexulose-6-phosphate synthase/6-phospho-3-hexuloisomerase